MSQFFKVTKNAGILSLEVILLSFIADFGKMITHMEVIFSNASSTSHVHHSTSQHDTELFNKNKGKL